MKVIGYVSGDDKERQKAKIKSYSELYGLELVVICEGEGRDKAMEFMGFANADGFIVYSLSNLTPSLKVWFELQEKYFTNPKKHLFSVSQGIDTRTANGKFLLHTILSLAQYEIERSIEVK